MRKKLALLLALLMLASVFCGKNRALRETIVERTFEIGFLEGFIFTMDVTAQFLTGTLTAADIDVEAEALELWETSGILYAEDICDSVGVVLDSSFANGLQGVYRIAFSAGIGAGERYITETILGDKPEGEDEMDEQALARAGFEEYRDDLLFLVEGIKLERKPVPDSH